MRGSNMQIELGDKVKCIYTGFIGIAIARTEFINGCVQIAVVPKVTKKNDMPEDVGIDEDSLIVVRKGMKIKEKKEPPGGAMRIAPSQRGY